MSSFKQIEANRQNALKSTGPTTLEGNGVHDSMLYTMVSRPRPSLLG